MFTSKPGAFLSAFMKAVRPAPTLDMAWSKSFFGFTSLRNSFSLLSMSIIPKRLLRSLRAMIALGTDTIAPRPVGMEATEPTMLPTSVRKLPRSKD